MIPRALSIALIFALIFALLGTAGCQEDSGATTLPSDCTPEYEATFQNVFDRTLTQKCSLAGGSCHAAGGARAGLVFEDIDASYSLLMNGYVKAGDAAGSKLFMAVQGDGAAAMPPGGSLLSEGQRCAIQQWIQAGAAR